MVIVYMVILFGTIYMLYVYYWLIFVHYPANKQHINVCGWIEHINLFTARL